jgi:hypothetical protein
MVGMTAYSPGCNFHPVIIVNHSAMNSNTKNLIFKLLLLAFLGFQTACLFYIEFGELSWSAFWYMSRISISVILVYVLTKGVIARN